MRDRPGVVGASQQSAAVPAAGDSHDDAQICNDVFCAQCGYNLRGLSFNGVCSECGSSVSSTLAQLAAVAPRRSGLLRACAFIVLFLALVGLACALCFTVTMRVSGVTTRELEYPIGAFRELLAGVWVTLGRAFPLVAVNAVASIVLAFAGMAANDRRSALYALSAFCLCFLFIVVFVFAG